MLVFEQLQRQLSLSGPNDLHQQYVSKTAAEQNHLHWSKLPQTNHRQSQMLTHYQWCKLLGDEGLFSTQESYQGLSSFQLPLSPLLLHHL
mmetsp:Transcript_2184/g.3447  ORF Transcript_2184/g.3447 Transcript_2184/m.3447 type:complete len:90 (+) Transcript_2184:1914-2183(+)